MSTDPTASLLASRVVPPAGAGGPSSISILVHDSTRLQWSVMVPLRERRQRYRLEAQLTFPTHVFAHQSPWVQLHCSARFKAPPRAAQTMPGTVEDLQREALEATRELGRAAEGLRRHCADAILGQATAPGLDLRTSLATWPRAAGDVVARRRSRIESAPPDERAMTRQERALADEYLSVQALWAFTEMARVIEEMAAEALPAEVLRARDEVAAELLRSIRAELEWRDRHRLPGRAADRASMERYLARASQLKKHFEAALYLDRESRAIEARTEPWIAAVATVLAGTIAFLLQAFLLRLPLDPSAAGLSSGVAMLAVAGGLVYAARERIKEVGRRWLRSGVERLTAQRVTRFVEASPEGRRVVASARESFETVTTSEPDPLNPLLGATVPRTSLRFVHEGRTEGARFALRGAHQPAIRLVFRYDVSPLLPRLHDPVKPIAVLEGDRLRLADAPRTYRIPVRVSIERDGHREEQAGTLVVNKYGLHRLDPPE